MTKGDKSFTLAQSKAIERYVASQTGLLGKSEEEAALIDSISELVHELQALYNAAKGSHVELTKFVNDVLPHKLAFVEKFIDVSNSGYTIGSGISLGDIYLYYFLATYLPPDLKVTEIISEKIATLITQVASVPGIARWVEGRAARNEPF